MEREIMVNYLENITDGEIYCAYDIICRILGAAAAKGSYNLSVLYDISPLCAANVWRLYVRMVRARVLPTRELLEVGYDARLLRQLSASFA
jgi:hypothetical protein